MKKAKDIFKEVSIPGGKRLKIFDPRYRIKHMIVTVVMILWLAGCAVYVFGELEYAAILIYGSFTLTATAVGIVAHFFIVPRYEVDIVEGAITLRSIRLVYVKKHVTPQAWPRKIIMRCMLAESDVASVKQSSIEQLLNVRDAVDMIFVFDGNDAWSFISGSRQACLPIGRRIADICKEQYDLSTLANQHGQYRVDVIDERHPLDDIIDKHLDELVLTQPSKSIFRLEEIAEDGAVILSSPARGYFSPRFYAAIGLFGLFLFLTVAIFLISMSYGLEDPLVFYALLFMSFVSFILTYVFYNELMTVSPTSYKMNLTFDGLELRRRRWFVGRNKVIRSDQIREAYALPPNEIEHDLWRICINRSESMSWLERTWLKFVNSRPAEEMVLFRTPHYEEAIWLILLFRQTWRLDMYDPLVKPLSTDIRDLL